MTSTEPKRFYTVVDVAASHDGFVILLDGKAVRTPGGAAQALPTKSLAEAIAEEWRAQGPKLDTSSMQLTKSVNSVIDRIAPRRAEVIADLAGFGESDLLCYRAEAPEILVRRQSDNWDPWLRWAAMDLGTPLKVTTGMTHIEQDLGALSAIRAAMEKFEVFSLPALHAAVTITGSAVLGLAFTLRRIGAEEAFALSQVDEVFQAERWGRDAEAEAARTNKLNELLRAQRLLDLLTC